MTTQLRYVIKLTNGSYYVMTEEEGKELHQELKEIFEKPDCVEQEKERIEKAMAGFEPVQEYPYCACSDVLMPTVWCSKCKKPVRPGI